MKQMNRVKCALIKFQEPGPAPSQVEQEVADIVFHLSRQYPEFRSYDPDTIFAKNGQIGEVTDYDAIADEISEIILNKFGRPSEKEIPHTQIRYHGLYDDSNPYYNKIQIAWLATDLSPVDEALL